MKVKLFALGAALGSLLISSCDDELSLVGPSIQPDSDKISVFQDTVQMTASTVLLDSIYAKTTTGLLGEIYDPLYGNLKSDYICQFYCPEGYKFKHEPLEGKIDSMDFQIIYSSWVGDSLAPMQAKVFEITSPLDRNYYTNVEPTDFCDMEKVLGSKTYTSYDMSIPDSIRKITDASHPDYYIPNVKVRLPKELGQNFYDETVNNPATFQNQESFNKFFPGLYVTTTYGTGNLLNVSRSSLFIYYRYKTKSEKTGNDTIVAAKERFNTTQEVIQLNSLKNGNLEQLLEPNEEIAYMKTPSGVCTKLILPIEEIKKIVDGRIVNDLPFKLTALAQEDWEYAFPAPMHMLLLPEDSVKSFFESKKMEDNVTSYVTSYPKNRIYNFGNISRLLEKHIEKDPEHALRLLAIPVNRVVEKPKNIHGQQGPPKTVVINHYMAPSGLKVKKDKESLKFVLTTSKYNDQ